MTGEALWAQDKDWLVDVVSFAKDEPEDQRAITLDWIGRVFGFAGATNTRMLAQVGDQDEDFPAYELWFSFDSTEHKQAFLDLVRNDGYANPDEECCFDPPPPEAMADIPNLHPLADVLPKEYMLRITTIAAVTAQTIMESAPGKVN